MPDKQPVNRVIYFVVGDKKLDAGNGIHVENLEEMKKSLVKIKQQLPWRLVISIHGADSVISPKGGDLKNPKAEDYYDADKIQKLFKDDEAFKTWREAFGPTWTTLNACQVHRKFEAVILSAFNKPDATQSAQGLGKGCRPLTRIMQYFDKNGTPIETRSQFSKLSEKEKDIFTQFLSEANDQYGYFGGPPVPKTHLLNYYFDEPPKGGWPIITVGVGASKVDSGISFFNRTVKESEFIDKCQEHMGPMLHGRTPAVPSVRDDR